MAEEQQQQFIENLGQAVVRLESILDEVRVKILDLSEVQNSFNTMLVEFKRVLEQAQGKISSPTPEQPAPQPAEDQHLPG